MRLTSFFLRNLPESFDDHCCWWFRNPASFPTWVVKNPVNNGIKLKYQPQLVSWPEFWLPSTVFFCFPGSRGSATILSNFGASFWMMIYTLTLKHGGLVDFEGYTIHSTQLSSMVKNPVFSRWKSTPIHHSPCFTRNPKDFTLMNPFSFFPIIKSSNFDFDPSKINCHLQNPNNKTFLESFPFS